MYYFNFFYNFTKQTQHSLLDSSGSLEYLNVCDLFANTSQSKPAFEAFKELQWQWTGILTYKDLCFNGQCTLSRNCLCKVEAYLSLHMAKQIWLCQAIPLLLLNSTNGYTIIDLEWTYPSTSNSLCPLSVPSTTLSFGVYTISQFQHLILTLRGGPKYEPLLRTWLRGVKKVFF